MTSFPFPTTSICYSNIKIILCYIVLAMLSGIVADCMNFIEL